MEAKKSGKSPVKNDSQERFCILYPKEKLRALRQYCAKKGIDPEEKGVEFLEGLYVKTVPKEVRAYIEGDDITAESEPTNKT